MLLERLEWSMRVRNQSELQSTPRQLPQHGLDIVVEKEVLVLRPLVVDLPRAVGDGWTGSTHLLDDAAGIADEDITVVNRLLRLVQDRRGGTNRVAEARFVNRYPVSRAEARVALTLKRGTGIDQREIDVEEDCADRLGIHEMGPSYGPATV